MLVSSLLILESCGEKPIDKKASHSTPDRKIIVLGVDGMDWAVIDRMFEEGRLPNIQRIVKGGVRAPLLSFEDFTKSPVLWSSIFTGRLPEGHGIKDFVAPNSKPGKGGWDRIASIHRKAPAIWNILSMHDMSVAVLGMWATYPAEKINGIVLSDYSAFLATKPEKHWGFTSEAESRLTSPPEFFEKVRPHLKPEAWNIPEPIARSLGQLTDVRFQERRIREDLSTNLHDHDLIYFKESFQEDYVKDLIGLEILANNPPQLYINYFRGTDVSQHFFWRYFEPDSFIEHPGEEPEFGNLITGYYEYVDDIVKRHLELLNDKDSLVIVSDHGGVAHANQISQIMWNKSEDMPKWRDRNNRLFSALGLKSLAYGVEDGLAGVSFAKDGAIDHIAFKLDPRAAEMSIEKLRGDVIDRVESMLILPSQEPLFKLRSAPEQPDDELVFDVRQSKEPTYSTDIQVGEQVFKIVDLFRLRKRSGDHRREGVFIGYGAAFRRGATLKDMSILDITPLLLALFDLPRDVKMGGKVPLEALQGPAQNWAKNQEAVDYSSTWTPGEGAALPDAEFMDQLKALGYLN
jgi:predicted AlkP superfamily phosphohydrolase/phosphomutase